MTSHSWAQGHTGKPQRSEEDRVGRQFLVGLTVAGAASTILVTTFGIFHVDTFLSAYKLPLASFAYGNFIYAFINTANDVGGAWLVDVTATRSSRSNLVGVSGCLFALCFLTPFFRWWDGSGTPSIWDTTHFVVSMSLYDTLYAFTAILFGSMFTDNHHLDEDTRVGMMAAGKFVNMLTSFVVAKIGLSLFRTDDLANFRSYLLALCVLASGLFILAQRIMHSRQLCSYAMKVDDMLLEKRRPTKKHLNFRRVVKDFARHSNFRYWIVMEMLMECQANFRFSFLKTFVDRLLLSSGLSHKAGDWLVSSIGPLSSIAAIAMYAPIRRYGYHRMYIYLFGITIASSLFLLLFGSPSSTKLVTSYLVVTSVSSKAVSSAGFHLAMSDMVTEMKYKQAKEQRSDEPSLAGLFMGANALVCKPMDSFLPIVAAWALARVGFSSDAAGTKVTGPQSIEHVTENELDVQRVLFYLLLLPSLIFSIIQLYAWQKYSLGDKQRAEEMRRELRQLQSEDEFTHT